MTADVLVAYGTRYGSTKEVAETVVATLEEQRLEVELRAAREVRTLDGYGAVFLGASLYFGALHKDVRALLERHQAALEVTPCALFALGPITADDGVDGSREQFFTALAKLPLPTPVATAVFVGAYDPARTPASRRLANVTLGARFAQDYRLVAAIRRNRQARGGSP